MVPTITIARIAYMLYGIDCRNTPNESGTSLAARSVAS